MKDLFRIISRRFMKSKRKSVSALAIIITFVMVYTLIMPAVALERKAAENEPGMTLEETVSGDAMAEAEPVSLEAEAAPAEESESEVEAVAADESAAEEIEEELEVPAAAQTVSTSADQGTSQAAGVTEHTQTEAEAAPSVSDADINDAEEGMPAQKFEQTVKFNEIIDEEGNTVEKQVKVKVDAEENAFPAGTVMKAEVVLSNIDPQRLQDMEDAIEAAIKKAAVESGLNADDTRVVQYQAIDINFFNKEGQKIQPAKKVEVRITSDKVREIENPVLVHVNENDKTGEIKSADVIEKKDISIIDEQPDTIENNENTMLFKTGRFSPFAIVESETVDENGEIMNGFEGEYSSEAGFGLADENDGTGNNVAADGSGVLMTSDGDYNVTVTYDANANIPAHAELQVKEITETSRAYQNYMEEAKDILEDNSASINYAKIFDVDIVSDGEVVTPEAEVDVDIAYKNSEAIEEGTVVQAVQFGEGIPEVNDDAFVYGDETHINGVQMKAAEIPVTAIVGTGKITAPFVAGDGSTYEVTVTYDDAAGIPAGAHLKVSEIAEDNASYDSYVKQTASAVDSDVSALDYIKLLDISILDENEEKVNLQGPVDVKIRLLDKEQEEENSQVVHFEGTRETPVVIDSSSEDDTVSFSTEGFSVFSIVYTVDFEYSVNGKVYQFSLPGGGFVSFTDLVEVLGIIDDTNAGENEDENGSVITENAEENAVEIVGTVDENATNEEAEENGLHSDKNTSLTLGDVVVSDASKKFVADVASVEFSNPELVDVSKVDADTTVGQIKESRGLEVEYSAELTEEQIAEINAKEVKAGDWALISVQPFDTEETLTVTMKDGEEFTIRMTDMQVNDPMGLHSKSFAIVSYKNYRYSALGSTTSSGYIDGKAVNVDTKDGVKICNEDAAAWTFEYVEDGKYYIHYGEHYLKINGTNSSNWSVQIVSRDEAGIINVTEQDGKYRFTNENNVALNNYNGNFWAYEQNGATNNSDEWMELRKPMKVSNPALVNTADTKSAGLTINLFDYGPDNSNGDSIDNVDHGNNNPSYVGINVNPANNSHRELLFFSYGNKTGNGINDFSGGRTAQQGILKTELDANNYPVLQSGNSLQYLFDDSEFNGKTVYSDVNHWFEQDSTGYYEYDSNKYYAYYDPNQGDEGTFKVYSDSHNEEGTKDNEKVGFFPFNEYSDCTCIHGYGSGFQNFDGHKSYNNGNLGHYNHHFGVNMTGNFYLPEDDTTTTADDIVFRFSGDDDMWVFIDGVLVLDIGGIHEQVSGEIDFTNDKITVSGAQTVTGGNGSALGTSSSLTAAFEKTQVEGGSNKTWDDSPFKSHRIDVFYFERGGMYSNCKISFNLPLISAKGEATVAKYDSSGNPAAPLEGVEFGLYTDPECNGDPVRTISSNASGLIEIDDLAVLTTDQKYYLKEIRELPGYKKNSNIYTLELGEPNEHGVYQFIIKDSAGETIETIGEEPAIPVIYNEPIEPIELSVEKQWEDVTGDSITPDNSYKAEFEVHRLKSYTEIITEEGEPEKTSTLKIGYYYQANNGQTIYGLYNNQSYSYVINTPATISYNYKDGHNNNNWNWRRYRIGQNGTVTENIQDNGTVNVTMPTEGQTVTVYFYDNWLQYGNETAFTSLSATGRAPQNTQIEREVIHTDEPDNFECDHLILTNGETEGVFDSGLFIGTDDEGKFPVQELKDGILYSYKYYITEVEESRIPSDFETIYKDGSGNVITNPKTLATDENVERVIINRKLLNIPFEKYWDIDTDHAPDAYYWTATLQLLSRLIDVESDEAVTTFEPVEGKKLTVSSDHAGQGSFNGLPMYCTQNDTEYRIQYSVREIAYLVKQTSDNTIKYQWQDPEYYPNPVETIGDEQFTLHYIQDAGENGNAIDDYSIIVNNTPDNREEKKSIDITLHKTWPADVDLSNAYADFVLKRYVYEEYRNFPAGTTDWVEITLNTGSEEKQKLRVPRGWNMRIFCHIKPNTNAENIKFDNDVYSYDNSSENSEHLFAIPITADQTKEITLEDGAQYVVGGAEGFRLSDINDENDMEVKLDYGFEIPVHLDAENDWRTVLHHLPAIEEAELYTDETTAFTRYVYRYFLEETGCSPENFDAVFKDSDNHLLGDSNNKIDFDADITANNLKKTGNIKVTKDLLGDVTGNDDRNFKVTIRNSENKYLQSDMVSFGDEAYGFNVSKSSPLEISGIPIGEYTITEMTGEEDVAISGFLWNVEESVTEEETTVIYNQTSEVEIKNYYDEIYNPAPSNMDVKENLTVNKIWSNLNGREPSADDEILVKISVDSAEAYVPVKWDLYDGNSNEVNNRNPLSGVYYVEPGSDVDFTFSRAENVGNAYKRIRLNSNVSLWSQSGSALQLTNRVPTNNQSQQGYAPNAASNTYTARDADAETPVEFRLQPWKTDAVWISDNPVEAGKWNMNVTVEPGKNYYSSVTSMRDALIDDNAVTETLVYSMKKGTTPQLVEELSTCNIRPDQVFGDNDGWTAYLNGLPTYQRITEDHDGHTTYSFRVYKYRIEEISINGEAVTDGKSDNYDVGYDSSAASGPTGKITTTTDITNTECSAEVRILKTDDEENSTNYLPDAVFELEYKQNEEDTWQTVSRDVVAQLDNNGRFTVPGNAEGITLTGLKAGYYRLTEITPPSGYVIIDETPVVFEVRTGEISNTNGTSNSVIYNAATEAIEADETNNIQASPAVPATFIVPNTPGAALPNTGGPGTRPYTVLGSILILGAGVLLWRRRRLI